MQQTNIHLPNPVQTAAARAWAAELARKTAAKARAVAERDQPVSYTHLTLPTTSRV